MHKPLELKYCNDTLQFPLPNRWATPDTSKAKQQTYMLLKQVLLSNNPAGSKQIDAINKDADLSRKGIEVMKFLKTLHLADIENVELTAKKYNVATEMVYTP